MRWWRRGWTWICRRYHLLDWVAPVIVASPRRLIVHVQRGRASRRVVAGGRVVVSRFQRSWTEEG